MEVHDACRQSLPALDAAGRHAVLDRHRRGERSSSGSAEYVPCALAERIEGLDDLVVGPAQALLYPRNSVLRAQVDRDALGPAGVDTVAGRRDVALGADHEAAATGGVAERLVPEVSDPG